MSLRPALIQNFNTDTQTLSTLQPIALDKPPYDENWLQNLIHHHPDIIPAAEIEASFSDIIPVVRELPLRSGYLDNLYITPSGYPVLVEVKLWKNHEARRKVVTQILEYAKDFAHLTYDALNAEVRKLRKGETWGDNPLYEIAADAAPGTPDEGVFVDRVTRNMREGRFLLLILGDGVREDMANLANYLMHHSLRYAFGIVQIKLFTLPDGSVMAVPDVMAETQTIERHVTVITATGGNIRVAENTPESQIVEERVSKTSLSRDDFFAAMTETAPDSVEWLKGFLQSLSDLPIEQCVGKNGESLMLKSPTGITLMHINPPHAAFWSISERFKKSPESMAVSREILEGIATLVSGEVKTFPAGGLDAKLNGKAVPLHSFHGKEQKLKEILNDAIEKIATLEDAI